MQIVYAQEGGRLRIRLQGELDHHAAKKAMAEMEKIIEENLPRSCVLDLSGVNFMDSSGIAVLLRARKRMEEIGGTVTAEGAPPQARRVLETAGIGRIITLI